MSHVTSVTLLGQLPRPGLLQVPGQWARSSDVNGDSNVGKMLVSGNSE